MEMKVWLTFAFMNLKSWRRLRSNGDSWRKKAQSQGLFYTIRLIKEKWLWDANPRAALSTVLGGQAMLALLNGCLFLVTTLGAHTIFIQCNAAQWTAFYFQMRSVFLRCLIHTAGKGQLDNV